MGFVYGGEISLTLEWLEGKIGSRGMISRLKIRKGFAWLKKRNLLRAGGMGSRRIDYATGFDTGVFDEYLRDEVAGAVGL